MSVPDSDFVFTYFTDHLTLVTLIILYSSAAALFLVFVSRRENPGVRSRALFSIFTILTVGWSFIASSLVLCQTLAGLYEVDSFTAVRTVFGLGLATSLALALPLSLFVTVRVPSIVSRRISRENSQPDDAVLKILRRRAEGLGLPAVRLIQSSSRLPFAYCVGRRDGTIVISEGLVERFDPDELDAVLMHELAHVKYKDTQLSTIISLYRKVLFFDPMIRLIELAFHREREFLADEFSARGTRRPLSLASALIKIHAAYSDNIPTGVPGLSIVGRTKFLKVPILRQRIERLMRLARELGDGEPDYSVAPT